MIPATVVVDSDDLALVVDPERIAHVGAGEGGNNGTEHPPIIKKSMIKTPNGCNIYPHNLAPVVDPISHGSNSAREGDIDRPEPPLVIDKAVRSRAIAVRSYDLAPVVDPACTGTGRAGDVDGGELVTGTICVGCLRVRSGHNRRSPESERGREKGY